MDHPMPDEKQARRLAVYVAGFWAGWGVAVIGGTETSGALAGLGALIGLTFGFCFYATLFSIWSPVTGRSGWRAILVPSFDRSVSRANRQVMLDLLRPSWIAHTIRETHWNAKLVGFGLLGLLLADVVLAVALGA